MPDRLAGSRVPIATNWTTRVMAAGRLLGTATSDASAVPKWTPYPTRERASMVVVVMVVVVVYSRCDDHDLLLIEKEEKSFVWF